MRKDNLPGASQNGSECFLCQYITCTKLSVRRIKTLKKIYGRRGETRLMIRWQFIKQNVEVTKSLELKFVL